MLDKDSTTNVALNLHPFCNYYKYFHTPVYSAGRVVGNNIVLYLVRFEYQLGQVGHTFVVYEIFGVHCISVILDNWVCIISPVHSFNYHQLAPIIGPRHIHAMAMLTVRN